MSQRVLQADAHLRRTDVADAAAPRRLVDVAVGVLIRADGRFLLTSRPAGKPYAGYWEFPGGKLEAGESVAQALVRELHEELGLALHTRGVRPWRQQVVDYPHALVRLHFCQVFEWQGEPQMREGQSHAWAALPLPADIAPILPGTVPVLQWLADEPPQPPAPHGARAQRAG